MYSKKYQNKKHTLSLIPEVFEEIDADIAMEFCDRICYRCSFNRECEIMEIELEATGNKKPRVESARNRLYDRFELIPQFIQLMFNEDEEEMHETTGIGVPLKGDDIFHPLLSAASLNMSGILAEFMECEDQAADQLNEIEGVKETEHYLHQVEILALYPSLIRTRTGIALYNSSFTQDYEDQADDTDIFWIDNVVRLAAHVKNAIIFLHSVNVLSDENLENMNEHLDFFNDIVEEFYPDGL